MHSHKTRTCQLAAYRLVLILVVMEDALAHVVADEQEAKTFLS